MRRPGECGIVNGDNKFDIQSGDPLTLRRGVNADLMTAHFGAPGADLILKLLGLGLVLATITVGIEHIPVASADPPGCLPLNGTQLNAKSFDNTNYFGITYASNVDYWYVDGAVNWHKTVDGGSLNLVHNDSTGSVPAAPGSTVAIPGPTAGGVSVSRPGPEGAPLLVTVCSK